MKTIFKFPYALFFSICVTSLSAQDYTIIPSELNASGNPGELFLSKAKIMNTGGKPIQIFMERIVKDIPPGWKSCFCYPTCIAPDIDTLRFNIPAQGTDSIMPNYGTDSVPGKGTIVVKIFQVGYENKPDTLTFTGTTLLTYLKKEKAASGLTVYPNPFTNELDFKNVSGQPYSLFIYDASGKTAFVKSGITGTSFNPGIGTYPEGIFYFRVEYGTGKTETGKILKIK